MSFMEVRSVAFKKKKTHHNATQVRSWMKSQTSERGSRTCILHIKQTAITRQNKAKLSYHFQ